MKIFEINIKIYKLLVRLLKACTKLSDEQLSEQADESETWSDDDPFTNPYASDPDMPSPADEDVDDDENNISDTEDLISNLFDDIISVSKDTYPQYAKQLNKANEKISESDEILAGYCDNSDIDREVTDYDIGTNILNNLKKVFTKKRLNDLKHPFPDAKEFYHKAHYYIEGMKNKYYVKHPFYKQWDLKNISTDKGLAKAIPYLINFALKNNQDMLKDYDPVVDFNAIDSTKHEIKSLKKILHSSAIKQLQQSSKNYNNNARYECYKLINTFA